MVLYMCIHLMVMFQSIEMENGKGLLALNTNKEINQEKLK